MKTYNATKRLSAQARCAIKNALTQHERYRSRLSPGTSAHQRRYNEKVFAERHPGFLIITKQGTLTVNPYYSESARYVRYRMEIHLGASKKTVRELKKLIGE